MSRGDQAGERVWHVYILLCRNGACYVGVTNDFDRRCAEHSSGRGGHYTKCNPPLRLVYAEQFATQSLAAARERQLKGWTRRKKLALASGRLELLKRLRPNNGRNISPLKACIPPGNAV